MAEIDGNSSSLAAQLQAQLLSGRSPSARPQALRTEIADRAADNSENNRQDFSPDSSGEGRALSPTNGPRLDRALSTEDDLGSARQRVNTLLTRESPFGRTSTADQRPIQPTQPGQIVDIRV